MSTLDPAIIAAAVATRQQYTAVQRAINEMHAGVRHASGSMAHDAVVAWRAASHALSHSPQGKAIAPEEEQIGGGTLCGEVLHAD